MQITLANLAEATPQQVFDQVVKHMLTQNRQSKNHEVGGCFYRHGDLKCAAGCLISDDEYKPEMDTMETGTTWVELVDNDLVPTTPHDDLIGRLQDIHDSYLPVDWPVRLNNLAKTHHLEFNV